MSAIYIAALLFASGTPANPDPVQTIIVPRADDSAIKAYVQRRSNQGNQSVLLVLQGSQCSDVGPGGSDRLTIALPDNMARLDVEKYGIDRASNGNGEKPCPPDYLANNSIQQRMGDVLSVISFLRTRASWWNHKLYLMGTSEGATVAAMTGPLMPETKGIVLINGSIGRPFRDGWADAMARAVAKDGGAEAEQAARLEAEATWAKARAEPRHDIEVFGKGNTLKWWASIIDLRPSNQLLLTDAPILLMQADRDEMTPVASARAVVEQFRKAGKANLTYVELPGLSHGLRQMDGTPGWRPVLDQVEAWLVERDRIDPNAGHAN